MKKFEHIDATTADEVVSALGKGKAQVIAGGTDLINTLKDEILPDSPETLVNIKTIPDMNYIKEEKGVLKIGALALIDDIASNVTVKEKYTALAEAAGRVASPNIRNMGTIGGNICQINRCWYYWVPNNRFYCMRKGGKVCYALTGDNRYHSIFGGVRVNGTPCSTDCPGGVDIPTYLAKVRDGDLVGAAKILLDFNPLPAVTGRVCPHSCESECNRGNFDEPISIRGIERFIGDYILENAGELVKPPQSDSQKSVAIVGSGPAGLSAAYYLRRLGHSVNIFEAMEEPGGLLTYGIPPYRLPRNVLKRQFKALEDTGIRFNLKVRVGNDVTLDDLRKNFGAVFLANGAWGQPALGIEGEELLASGIEFLTQVGLGLRTSPGRKILVIGGGNAAVSVALTALRLGAAQVTMVCLETREEMPATPSDVEKAVEEGVKLMPSWGTSRVLKRNGKVSGMELVRCTSVYDSQGNFAPTYDKNIKETVGADHIILAIGQRADLSFAKPLEVKKGLIVADPATQATSLDGVFAGGDVTRCPASVIEAIAAGRRAAGSIDKYLTGKGKAGEGEGEAQSSLRFNSDYLAKTSRAQARELPISERSVDVEDVFSLDQTEVEAEANRCFNCGCVAVNSSDIAPALIALDAKIKTTKRVIEAEKFFALGVDKTTALDADEVVTEVQIPASSTKSAFIKFALRKAIDFPIVNCAVAINGKVSRICLNGVSGIPYRAKAAEEAISGKSITEATAEAAGEAAVSDALALTGNKYKVQIAKVMVKRALLACK